MSAKGFESIKNENEDSEFIDYQKIYNLTKELLNVFPPEITYTLIPVIKDILEKKLGYHGWKEFGRKRYAKKYLFQVSYYDELILEVEVENYKTLLEEGIKIVEEILNPEKLKEIERKYNEFIKQQAQ